MTPNIHGALLMMASMAAFTLNDACIKLAGEQVPLWQMLTLRGIASSVLILALAWYTNALSLSISRRDWGLIAIRSGAEIAAAYFFLTALLSAPLANVSAVLQVLPLTVTLGAALFFHETIGWRRMLAIGIGFCGMLLIVRPGPDGFTAASVNALFAVAAVTVRDLITRRMSAQVPSLTVTLIAAVSVLVFASVASLGTVWVPVDLTTGALIAAASFLIMGAYLFSVAVMRVGDVGFVAPFRYTGLVWALILGWLVFGDWPDAITLIGAGLVVGSGLFAFYRETRASG